jgi:hypothetical protein
MTKDSKSCGADMGFRDLLSVDHYWMHFLPGYTKKPGGIRPASKEKALHDNAK